MAKIRFQDVVKKVEHTKTPWFNAVFDHADRIGILRDVTQPGDTWNSADPIAYIEMIEGNTNQPIPEAMANAEFIVKAVNSHEALLEEVKELKGKAEKWMDEATHQATERDSNFALLQAKKNEVRELEKQVAGLMSGMNLNLYRDRQKSLQNINEELIDLLKQVKRHADGYNIDGKYRIHRPTIESETAKNWDMLIRLIEKVLNNDQA